MRASRSRPFTLSDAMIIIAAMAIGLGVGIAYDHFRRARRDQFERPQVPGLDELPPLPAITEPGQEPPQALAEDSSSQILPPPPPPSSSVLAASLKFIRVMAARGIVTSSSLFRASCTLGLLVLRLRQPRPRIRQFALRPGSTAFVAVLFIFPLHGSRMLNIVMTHPVDGGSRISDLIEYGSWSFGANTGPYILLVWMVLAFGRRWRVSGWIEWSGLAVGIIWLLVWVVDTFLLEWVPSF